MLKSPPPLLEPLGVRNKKNLPLDWKDDPSFFHIGRPSIFGNPFKLPFYTRDEAIEKFIDYANNNDNIKKILSNKYIVCSCHPLMCHCDFFIQNLSTLTQNYLIL